MQPREPEGAGRAYVRSFQQERDPAHTSLLNFCPPELAEKTFCFLGYFVTAAAGTVQVWEHSVPWWCVGQSWSSGFWGAAGPTERCPGRSPSCPFPPC